MAEKTKIREELRGTEREEETESERNIDREKIDTDRQILTAFGKHTLTNRH